MLIKPSGSAGTVDKGTVRLRRYGVRRTHWTRRSRFCVFWWLMSDCSVPMSLYSYIVSVLCLRDHRRSVQSTDPFWRYVQKTLACYNNSDVFNFRRQNIYFVSWLLLLLLLLLLLYLSSLCRTFTIIYLQQTMFLRYTVLQLFCVYNLCYL